MRLTILTVGVLLSAGFAFAAHAVDEPAPLDAAKCDAAWTMASPAGDAISKDQVTPYVINYTMVDSDADGKVSAEEFKKGCAAGQVKAADESTVKGHGEQIGSPRRAARSGAAQVQSGSNTSQPAMTGSRSRIVERDPYRLRNDGDAPRQASDRNRLLGLEARNVDDGHVVGETVGEPALPGRLTF